jgi:hypothetical protein
VKPKRRTNFSKRLVIMAKSPVLGRVKRRLAGEIGEVAALRFYRSCLSYTLLRLARDPRWHCVLAIAPDRDVAAGFWPPRGSIARCPQGEGDPGRRMQRLFRRLPPGPVIVVGSDIPAIQPRHVAEAFRRLGNADAVLGPAPDGGYWLVGLKRVPRLLAPFADVRWSGPHALADTLANLDGKRVLFAATLSDVDIAQDFHATRGFGSRLILRDIPPRQVPGLIQTLGSFG